MDSCKENGADVLGMITSVKMKLNQAFIPGLLCLSPFAYTK
jgi:hypothetical protein